MCIQKLLKTTQIKGGVVKISAKIKIIVIIIYIFDWSNFQTPKCCRYQILYRGWNYKRSLCGFIANPIIRAKCEILYWKGNLIWSI